MQNGKNQKKSTAGGLDKVINLASPRVAGLRWVCVLSALSEFAGSGSVVHPVSCVLCCSRDQLFLWVHAHAQNEFSVPSLAWRAFGRLEASC